MGIWNSLGASTKRVDVVDYRPEWGDAFERESRRILTACGDTLLSVEHIGSTAVPGLAAKPCLDIMPGLRQTSDGKSIVEPMISLGYRFLGEHGMPGRWYFVLFHNDRCVVHAHAYSIDNVQWERHLFFRDYLRKNPETSHEYGELKRALQAQHENDKHAYTNAKTDFVKAIETKAPNGAPAREAE